MPRFRKSIPVDDYVFDVLMRDLVGHDQQPGAFLSISTFIGRVNERIGDRSRRACARSQKELACRKARCRWRCESCAVVSWSNPPARMPRPRGDTASCAIGASRVFVRLEPFCARFSYLSLRECKRADRHRADSIRSEENKQRRHNHASLLKFRLNSAHENTAAQIADQPIGTALVWRRWRLYVDPQALMP